MIFVWGEISSPISRSAVPIGCSLKIRSHIGPSVFK